MRWFNLIWQTAVGWFLIISAAYFSYFSMDDGPVKDKEILSWVEEFRLVCFEAMRDERCYDKEVDLRWKVSWEPPRWAWQRGWITPFDGIAPFYFLPINRQLVILEPRYWRSSNREENKNTLFHELGHAVLGWGHSDNPRSLMHRYGTVAGASLGEAFEVARKENEE